MVDGVRVPKYRGHIGVKENNVCALHVLLVVLTANTPSQIVCSGEVTKVYESNGEKRAEIALSVRNDKGERKIDGDATAVA